MRIKDYAKIERASSLSRGEVGRLGTAILFVIGVILFTGTRFADFEQSHLLVAAAVIGAYMAMNIGANDVANNVGPAVGSFALSLSGAIVIAAVFEAAGAIIAGGEVVKTVKNGIVDPDDIGTGQTYVWVMMGALIGAALWLNLATWLGAPVSTTHSIVGGVMGASMAAAGWNVVNWSSVASIALSWVVSPVMGGVIAAAFLFLLKRLVFFRDDPAARAERVVPVMIGILGWAFTTYIALKGIKQIVSVSFPMAMLAGDRRRSPRLLPGSSRDPACPAWSEQ
ncbi:MAG: anion permease [Burkholderiaceae bacterium]